MKSTPLILAARRELILSAYEEIAKHNMYPPLDEISPSHFLRTPEDRQPHHPANKTFPVAMIDFHAVELSGRTPEDNIRQFTTVLDTSLGPALQSRDEVPSSDSDHGEDYDYESA